MRVLVTGYHGYIGTVLSRLLMANGHQVIGADIHLYERCTFGSPAPRLALRPDASGSDSEDRENAALSRERATGVEPATLCLASIRSSQLSYTRIGYFST